ncbi:type III restriction-modification enzyme helicase subunit [Thiobacillus denitrificans ATCC 25259]|uniref:Type III restriction-modification enzyme helicase subunit n=1 Tax=Thiobacillus denitrificans (strain ATCC 25259 / T1) TaxID=292415 RepID=Q3SIT0_THIDA|nr:DEAD/DEAH box helicase family protein [Thiobacillus denitrificans]AAZ97445.1 type III restriction-modification enzyme helicase subunit [Thiobacillus denitrificans ATCC 25259]
MALHPELPESPYDELLPDQRWFPAAEELRSTAYEKLLPPLVAKIREEIKAWRDANYAGASGTSRALLNWWFGTGHLLEQADGSLSPYRYYFAQREAVETVIWLHDVRKVRDKFDLLRFDASGAASSGMFPEDWPRYVVKMATGAGKTKVLSLLMAWSYFHKLYEADSPLSRNFLLIAPNIIVLDRLRADFDGLRIFFNDPILPDNGFEGQNWRDDFQMTLHIQDDVRVQRDTGNLFLTNIHRVYLSDIREPTLEDDDLRDYFLSPFGSKPSGKTTDSRADLGEIVRELDELAVFNDEAHHIHDDRLAWFKSIQDIHHRMLQKDGRLALQVDVTATPKHNNGAIFVQTVSDYPLVEAIHQNVVKHPVLPDPASRARLQEHKSAIFTEHYADYLNLGIEEWRKSYAEHEALGKKAVMFVMVDDTKNCDEVGAWLEKTCPELQGAVLVIHTKNNGEISESATGKNKEELERLRKQSNEIDSWASPYKAIVSVLMLKEGWDVRNVTTIVGLRAYAAQSNILPEQTLGRGLRRMYFGSDTPETVSVMGTPTFMEFVESIQSEGVQLEYRPMGGGTKRQDSLVVEVEAQNADKDLDALDIELPRLTRRFNREYQDIDALDPARLGNAKLKLKDFTPEETREIVFKTMLDAEIHHTILLDGAGPADYRSVVGFFARQLLKELRLVGGYDVLYPKVKTFMAEHLFADSPVSLDDPVVLRNLSEPDAGKVLFDAFKKAINTLTVQDTGTCRIEDRIRLRDTRPFRTENRPYFAPKKSVFSKIVGEPHAGGFEMAFASFLDDAPDVVAFAKNYLAVGFKIDYVKADGDLSNYVPDFLLKTADGTVWIIETKGRAELDLPQKMARLRQWCADATQASQAEGGAAYRFVYVDQQGYERNPPKTFAALAASFTEFQEI